MLTITAFRTKMWLRRGANQFTNCINHCTTLSTMFIILFRFLTSHVTKVECFSDSIPLSDCSPMKSIHGVQPQQGPHPFVTYADKVNVYSIFFFFSLLRCEDHFILILNWYCRLNPIKTVENNQ